MIFFADDTLFSCCLIFMMSLMPRHAASPCYFTLDVIITPTMPPPRCFDGAHTSRHAMPPHMAVRRHVEATLPMPTADTFFFFRFSRFFRCRAAFFFFRYFSLLLIIIIDAVLPYAQYITQRCRYACYRQRRHMLLADTDITRRFAAIFRSRRFSHAIFLRHATDGCRCFRYFAARCRLILIHVYAACQVFMRCCARRKRICARATRTARAMLLAGQHTRVRARSRSSMIDYTRYARAVQVCRAASAGGGAYA